MHDAHCEARVPLRAPPDLVEILRWLYPLSHCVFAFFVRRRALFVYFHSFSLYPFSFSIFTHRIFLLFSRKMRRPQNALHLRQVPPADGARRAGTPQLALLVFALSLIARRGASLTSDAFAGWDGHGGGRWRRRAAGVFVCAAGGGWGRVSWSWSWPARV